MRHLPWLASDTMLQIDERLLFVGPIDLTLAIEPRFLNSNEGRFDEGLRGNLFRPSKRGSTVFGIRISSIAFCFITRASSRRLGGYETVDMKRSSAN